MVEVDRFKSTLYSYHNYIKIDCRIVLVTNVTWNSILLECQTMLLWLEITLESSSLNSFLLDYIADTSSFKLSLYHSVYQAHMLKGKGNLMELVDRRLGLDFYKNEVTARINVSLLCTNVTASLRPTMSLVVSMLEGRSVVQEVFSESSEALDEKKLEAMRQRYQEIIEENKLTENKLTEIQRMTYWLLHHLQQISIL